MGRIKDYTDDKQDCGVDTVTCTRSLIDLLFATAASFCFSVRTRTLPIESMQFGCNGADFVGSNGDVSGLRGSVLSSVRSAFDQPL